MVNGVLAMLYAMTGIVAAATGAAVASLVTGIAVGGWFIVITALAAAVMMVVVVGVAQVTVVRLGRERGGDSG